MTLQMRHPAGARKRAIHCAAPASAALNEARDAARTAGEENAAGCLSNVKYQQALTVYHRALSNAAGRRFPDRLDVMLIEATFRGQEPTRRTLIDYRRALDMQAETHAARSR